MDFPTLPYLYVTISFLSEICFLVPTHPTFIPDVTKFTLFFFEVFPNKVLEKMSTNFPQLRASGMLTLAKNFTF